MGARKIWLLLFLTGPLLAKDFGSFGKTYPIHEMPADHFIEKKIKNLSPVQKQRIENLLIEKTQQAVRRPRGFDLPVVKQSSHRLLDPTIHFNEEIRDANNRVVIPAGQQLNPLDYVSLTQPLIFINGDDLLQKKWIQKNVLKGMLILIKGDPLKLEKELNRESIYFDQNGRLVERFSLVAVPSVIRQEGKYLRIDECAVQ